MVVIVGEFQMLVCFGCVEYYFVEFFMIGKVVEQFEFQFGVIYVGGGVQFVDWSGNVYMIE